MEKIWTKIDESIGIYRFSLNFIVIMVILSQFIWGLFWTIGITIAHFSTLITSNLVFWIMALIIWNIITWYIERLRHNSKIGKQIVQYVESKKFDFLNLKLNWTPSIWESFQEHMKDKETVKEKYKYIYSAIIEPKQFSWLKTNLDINEEEYKYIMDLYSSFLNVSSEEKILTQVVAIVSIVGFVVFPPLRINPEDISISLYKKDLEYSTMEFNQTKEYSVNAITELTDIKKGYEDIWNIEKVKEIEAKINSLK